MDKLYLGSGIVGLILVIVLTVMYMPDNISGVLKIIVGFLLFSFFILKGISLLKLKHRKDNNNG